MKYCLAVCVFQLFSRSETISDKIWIVANRVTNIRYETEIVVQAARVNEKGNCGFHYSRAASKS